MIIIVNVFIIGNWPNNTMDYIAHGPRPKMANFGPNKILDLNRSFDRSLSKLSLKLLLLKDIQLRLM